MSKLNAAEKRLLKDVAKNVAIGMAIYLAAVKATDYYIKH